MERVSVRIINKSGWPAPAYAKPGDAGCDLHADITEPVVIKPWSSVVISSGISIALPDGYEAQVRGRSGLNFKHCLIVPIGTIDGGYRGVINVKIYNLSNEPYTLAPGEKMAQLVIAPVVQADWEMVDTLDETERGEGGFGHTGK